jgi:hypothetical protein
MAETPKQPQSENPEGVPKPEGLRIELTNSEGAKQMFADVDDFERFKLQTTLDFMDKLSKQNDKGTALYEKLILLDGAAIALSITLITSLSSRLAAGHGVERLHLWMVDVSWSLLILSIFFSYHVIVRRHTASLSMFLTFSSEFTNYIYQRVGVTVSYLKAILKGEVLAGTETIKISKFFEAVPSLLNQEKENSLKKISDTISEWQKGNEEIVFARLAVYSTISAVVILCVFTILSVSLLF